MSKKKYAKDLKVVSPCTEDWEAMSGNEKVRFCSHCELSVNNLSEMTKQEAKKLARDSDGRLCVRYIKHPKTQAPVFADKLYKITRQTGIAAGVLGASLAATSLTYAQGTSGEILRTRTETPTVSKSDNAFEKDKTSNGSGKISGAVTDQAGAVIPNALVKITSGNFSKSTMSDSNGSYLFENIPIGTYEILFNAPGFSEHLVKKVTVQDKSYESINVQLEVQKVFVSGAIAFTQIIENPLIQAVYNEKEKEVRSLIARGTDVNAKDKGFSSRTALHTAVEENNLKIVSILLNSGADVNLLDENGNTPLMMLDEETNVEIIKLLVKYGTNLNIQNTENKRTALINAAMEDNFKAMRVLIEAGADVNLRDSDGDSALDLIDNDIIEQLLIGFGAQEKSDN